MHDPVTISYLERRERDERALADRSSDQSARSVHLIMARRYRRRLVEERDVAA